jgi:rod shape-determining protein MreC
MTRMAAPSRAWVQRGSFAIVIGLVLVLAMMSRMGVGVVERTRVAANDAVAPVLEALGAPIDLINKAVSTARDLVILRDENERLRLENQRLREWQSAAGRLQAENAALRELVRVAPDPGLRYIAARVIADRGAYVHSVLVNAGADQGVRNGFAVLTAEGLAGRVIEVGAESSRVLLATDINSRIPVVVERSRDRAVLAGDNSAQPVLLYLSPDASIEAGDRIVTSGHGGVFPPGLAIGTVIDVEIDGAGEKSARVQPFVDWDRLEFVRVADYELPGILLSADEARRRAESPVPAPSKPIPVAVEPYADVDQTQPKPDVPAHRPSLKPPLNPMPNPAVSP